MIIASRNRQKKMRVTQLRIYAILLTLLATLLTSVALATNKWYEISSTDSQTGNKSEYSYGLFYCCSDGMCKLIEDNQGWRVAIIACIITAIALSISIIAALMVIIFLNKKAKFSGVLLLITAVLKLAALITYPVKMKVSSEGNMGVSYYIGFIGMIVSTGAGIFALATREERVAPSLDFVNI